MDPKENIQQTGKEIRRKEEKREGEKWRRNKMSCVHLSSIKFIEESKAIWNQI